MSDEYGSVAAKPASDEKEPSVEEDSPSSEAKPSTADGGGEDEEIARLGPNYRRDPATNGLVYVDPQTKQEFVLNADKTDWVPKTTADGTLTSLFLAKTVY